MRCLILSACLVLLGAGSVMAHGPRHQLPPPRTTTVIPHVIWYYPQTTITEYRWGLFGRRLVPRTRVIYGPPVLYHLTH